MFGLRWLLRRLEIYPNAYYNYRKHRKADYYAHKAEVQTQLQTIYHAHNGVDGYRSMKVYLERKGYVYSAATVYKYMNTELGLHSDQGSQYTSKAFIEFCESVKITQSMSKAGYPYDNAPMERYFNTLKNECTNLYDFETEEALYQKVEEFAYVDYNHLRPHTFNGYRTPYQARIAS